MCQHLTQFSIEENNCFRRDREPCRWSQLASTCLNLPHVNSHWNWVLQIVNGTIILALHSRYTCSTYLNMWKHLSYWVFSHAESLICVYKATWTCQPNFAYVTLMVWACRGVGAFKFIAMVFNPATRWGMSKELWEGRNVNGNAASMG
jgi:hypothetical protein